MRNALNPILQNNPLFTSESFKLGAGYVPDLTSNATSQILFAYKRMGQKLLKNVSTEDILRFKHQFMITVAEVIVNLIKDNHLSGSFLLTAPEGKFIDIAVNTAPCKIAGNKIVFVGVDIIGAVMSSESFSESICLMTKATSTELLHVFPVYPLTVSGWLDNLLTNSATGWKKSRGQCKDFKYVRNVAVFNFLQSLKLKTVNESQFKLISNRIHTAEQFIKVIEFFKVRDKRIETLPYFYRVQCRGLVGMEKIAAAICKDGSYASTQYAKLLNGEITLGGRVHG